MQHYIKIADWSPVERAVWDKWLPTATTAERESLRRQCELAKADDWPNPALARVQDALKHVRSAAPPSGPRHLSAGEWSQLLEPHHLKPVDSRGYDITPRLNTQYELFVVATDRLIARCDIRFRFSALATFSAMRGWYADHLGPLLNDYAPVFAARINRERPDIRALGMYHTNSKGKSR